MSSLGESRLISLRLHKGGAGSHLAEGVCNRKYKLRGVDNKIVPVDSFCSLIIGWECKKTKLSEVAVIKTLIKSLF